MPKADVMGDRGKTKKISGRAVCNGLVRRKARELVSSQGNKRTIYRQLRKTSFPTSHTFKMLHHVHYRLHKTSSLASHNERLHRIYHQLRKTSSLASHNERLHRIYHQLRKTSSLASHNERLHRIYHQLRKTSSLASHNERLHRIYHQLRKTSSLASHNERLHRIYHQLHKTSSLASHNEKLHRIYHQLRKTSSLASHNERLHRIYHQLHVHKTRTGDASTAKRWKKVRSRRDKVELMDQLLLTGFKHRTHVTEVVRTRRRECRTLVRCMMNVMQITASRKWFIVIGWITLWQHLMIPTHQQRSFGIDYDKNTFVKDGQPFRYISGSMHYARVPRPSWQDRLRKIRSTGVNTVQTYVPWNYHERTISTYSNLEDVKDFIALVNQTGLLIIVRPGPYICAEWDMGGLPAWLLKTPSIRLRSSDTDYVAAVDRWMAVLLPMIYPWLYQNGGPIIAVQVENEYGSYGCDAKYLRHLLQLFRLHLGNDVLLFTSDEPKLKSLQCGSLQGLYSTINFGSDTNATEAFLLQRKMENKGPLVNSEFYTGWLDYWGHKHSTKASSMIAHALDTILSTGASVNMYMFEGGTNFGYWSGADYKTTFLPVTTSYDYDAPLSEAGDPTDKLFAIRDVIRKYIDEPLDPVPPPALKYPYGFVPMRLYNEVIELLHFLAPYPPVKSKYPIDFEQMNQSHGFLLYQTSLPKAFDVHTPLKSSGIHDRAYVTLNGTFQGVLERDGVSAVNVCGPKGARLDLLVENMGRIGFGHQIHEHKGIVSNVTLGGEILNRWFVTSLDMEVPLPELHDMDRKPLPHSAGPAFYTGSFTLPRSVFTSPRDTFLRLQGWTKGFVWINGGNLGRYWSLGPQQTLYVPGSFLSRFLPNNVTILELEHSPCSSGTTRCLVRFIDQPILGVASQALLDQPSLPEIH